MRIIFYVKKVHYNKQKILLDEISQRSSSKSLNKFIYHLYQNVSYEDLSSITPQLLLDGAESSF